MKKFKTVLFFLLMLVLLGTIGIRLLLAPEGQPHTVAVMAETAAPSPSPAPAASSTPAPTPEPTPVPTPEPTPTPTPEPTPVYSTISIIGDCTLTSHQQLSAESPYSYAGRMNGDYAYPFHNTVQYFAEDALTIANLECCFSDEYLYSASTFYFRAPKAYANILVEGGVDFVTTANNHMMDFGQPGADSTYATLEEYGIPYGKDGEAQIVTTDTGIKVGIYCAYNGYYPKQEDAVNAIHQLQADGADYIVCAFHWGQDEGTYRVKDYQRDLGHACIDAGADVVYGSHAHVLQPIEEYNGGLILYCMGNWSFGGNSAPRDRDTAIVQIVLRQDPDGSLNFDDYFIIPCCVSSLPVLEDYTGDAYNDYCPTPYEQGDENYMRVLSKLDGSFDGPDLNVDYTSWYASFN